MCFISPHCTSAPKIALVLILVLAACQSPGPPKRAVENVQVVRDQTGFRLNVDGRDFFVMGMNWDYFPIGTNYRYRLWDEPDDVIEEALNREMSLMKAMGVNAIRQYVGVPPRWVTWIHEHYGIYTILNHPLGRYGVSVGGMCTAPTDYADPQTREAIIAEVLSMVEAFRDTPGVLIWLLGNENNYGLVWQGAETEDLPEAQRDLTTAKPLYSLFGETARRIKEVDTLRPVAMANGDMGYLDLIVEHASDVDIFGMNTYRGTSFTDAWDQMVQEWDRPILLTEFGADAWNALSGEEAQREQAVFLASQWQEIYAHAAGQSGHGHSIGGLTFQWSDGWWKYNQEDLLDVHDTHASWSNGGYAFDYVEGANNMNEEWFGIVAKAETDQRMQFGLLPRAAYYTLQHIHELDPLTATPEQVRAHFQSIDIDKDLAQAIRAN